jgi:DNA-binding MarR family transcriptional regulator
MIMKPTNEEVIDRLQRVINKILFLKRKSLFQFQGVEFYPSEIHLMLVIKEKSATNATRMSEQLGVTKGAVSQTLSRLEKKGVLNKTKDPYNKNELTLTFTPFGAEAFTHYSIRVAEAIEKHSRYLERFTDDEKAIIQRFLAEVESVFDEME